jgi:lauroyl/myristoyl acyltransferase
MQRNRKQAIDHYGGDGRKNWADHEQFNSQRKDWNSWTMSAKGLSVDNLHTPFITPGDLEHLAVLTLATGLNLLPATLRGVVLYQLSRAVGTIWHKSNRSAVQRVRRHIRVLFGFHPATIESLVRDQLVTASWNALLINLLPSLQDKHLPQLCHIEGLDQLDQVRRQGKPILLLGFHYGSYGYLIAAALTAHGFPTWLIGYGDAESSPQGTSRLYRKLYWPRVQRLKQRVRTTTVDPGAEVQPQLMQIFERSADIAYLLADQYFAVGSGQDHPAHLVPLLFLDHIVYLDTSALRMAKKSGAQPFTAVPIRDGNRERVVIEPFEWDGGGTRTADISHDLQLYLIRLEQRLVEYPAPWRDLRRKDLLYRLGVSEGEASGAH